MVLARGGEVFTAAAARQEVKSAIEYYIYSVDVAVGLKGGERAGRGVLYKILGQSGETLI